MTPYRSLRFGRGEIPSGLLGEHTLKAGTHGELRVIEGHVVFVGRAGRRLMSTGDVQRIAPQEPHHLEDADDASIELVFLRET